MDSQSHIFKQYKNEVKNMLGSPFQVNFHFLPEAYQAAMKFTPH